MKICRQLLYLIFLFSFACATLGMDGSSGPATVLHASRKVQVNGAGSRAVTTLFSGDSVPTDADSVANIIAGGSSVLVMPNASVKFLGNYGGTHSGRNGDRHLYNFEHSRGAGIY